MNIFRRGFQHAIAVATGLVVQQHRNVTGNPSRRIVLGRITVGRQQADLRAGQPEPFEKCRIPVAHPQQAFVRAGDELQGRSQN